ncbi:MAG TPA: MFS transporter, partial [Acidimicrobiales bacterium]|nr:MFS transporter [Acidimicrobiales bacterium]
MGRMRLGALQERSFRTVFIGQAVSSIGNALVPVALAFAILRDTGSAADLGWVLASEQLAGLLLFLFGGVIADRFPRRTVMIVADSTRAAGELSLGLLFVLGHPPIPAVAVLAAVQGLAGGVFTPAAMGLTPSVVSEDRLQQANMLQSMAANAAYVVGPAAGGVLVLTVGGGWAILADGVSFAVNVVMLLRVSVDLPSRPAKRPMLVELREGWSAFASRRWYRNLVLAFALNNFLMGAYMVLGPVTARHYYGGAGAWAAVGTCGAIGGIVGGFATMRLRPAHPLRTATYIALLWPLVPLTFGLLLPLPVVCVASGLGLLGALTFNDLLYTAVQKVVPDDVLSRVISYDYF